MSWHVRWDIYSILHILHAVGGDKLTFALAGDKEEVLQQLLTSYRGEVHDAPEVKVLVCALDSTEQVDALVRQGRCVLNTVSPFSLYGTHST
jgi:hypothetical protein